MSTSKKSPLSLSKAPASTVTRPAPAKKFRRLPATKKAFAVKPVAKVLVKPIAAKKVSAARTSAGVTTSRSNASPKQTAQAEVITKTIKADKARKPKLVRDSFTIPKAEYLVLEALKQRANGLAQPTKKSELLRAGIKALAAMTDAVFLKRLRTVPAIKTGRPATAL